MKLIGYITRRRCIGKKLAFADIHVEEIVDFGSIKQQQQQNKEKEKENEEENDDNNNNDDDENKEAAPKEEKEEDWIGTMIQIVFQRDSPAWNKQWDETFPDKATKLPYGGKVMLNLAMTKEEGKQDTFENYDVCSWELLENPREEALIAATQVQQQQQKQGQQEGSSSSTAGGGGGGISCSVYLKFRADAYSRFNDDNKNHNNKNTQHHPKKTRTQQRQQRQQDSEEYTSDNVDAKEDSTTTTTTTSNTNIDNDNKPSNQKGDDFFSHGDQRAKSMRAKIFASWLIQSYGVDNLKRGCGVLDIAGGKGKLSIALAVEGNIPSTIIDPLVRKRGEKLEPREAKKIRKLGAPHPKFVTKPFNQTSFLNKNECVGGDNGNVSEGGGEELLLQSSICVGLHPDECTEDILDVALRYDKSVAIVPCCVFTGFFPLRRLPNGNPVRTYEEFIQYLLSKDERLQIETLPFEGRNQVIFYFHKDNEKEEENDNNNNNNVEKKVPEETTTTTAEK